MQVLLSLVKSTTPSGVSTLPVPSFLQVHLRQTSSKRPSSTLDRSCLPSCLSWASSRRRLTSAHTTSQSYTNCGCTSAPSSIIHINALDRPAQIFPLLRHLSTCAASFSLPSIFRQAAPYFSLGIARVRTHRCLFLHERHAILIRCSCFLHLANTCVLYASWHSATLSDLLCTPAPDFQTSSPSYQPLFSIFWISWFWGHLHGIAHLYLRSI